ncbi:MAG: GNAT family N-acetyltransferase [Leptolyngbyaceae cyanobacterium SL_7_1]|nr:GNAT family N-acetyltransferase [Leptolyngbyaceae cyanobacterium SL_7_1]
MQLIHLKAAFDGCPEAVMATADRLKQDLFGEAPLSSVLLVEISGDIIGFATYHSIYSTFLAKPGLWLDDLFLKPQFRGQGIGTQLMQRLCEIAIETGCERIDWTVAVGNNLGIQFYEKIGATIQQEVRLCRLHRKAIERHTKFALLP